eukprot:s554_g24.t1
MVQHCGFERVCKQAIQPLGQLLCHDAADHWIMAYNQYAYSNAQAPLSVPRMSSTEAKRSGIMFGRTRSDAMQSLEATEGPIGRSLAAEEAEGHDAGEEIEADPKPKFQANLVCGIFDERPFFPSVLFLSTALGAFVMLTEQRSILIDMSGSAWFFTFFFTALYVVTLSCLTYCLLSDPGQMDRQKYADMKAAGLPMPKRSHKAWLYKRPIRRFDHYCRWVTNVIGYPYRAWDQEDGSREEIQNDDESDDEEVEVAEDGLFDYEVRCTVASGEPVKGLELPALDHRDAPATESTLFDRKEAGPSSLREAGNNCCSEELLNSLYATALQTSGELPSPRLFSNRAAARLKLAKWEEALQDIMEATKRDPANPKVCRCLS